MPPTLTRERELIRDALHALPGRVTLRSYTSDVDSTYSRAERALLEEIAAGSPNLTLPDGYELPSFLSTIRAVAEGRSGLSTASAERLRALRTPCHLEVFASPG